MTIPFKELAGSPIESYQPEGMRAERRLLCAYEDRYRLAAALLGSNGLGAPAVYYPAHPALVPTRIQVEPFEKRPDDRGTFDDLTSDLNSYSGQFVELVVQYEMFGIDGKRPKLPDCEPGTILTYRMDFGGEYVLLPGHALQWQADSTLPVPPEAVPTLRVPITEHHVTWHRVVNPPWDAIRQCVGAVNAGDFAGAAAETVLFDGARADRQFTGLDDLMQPEFGWRITYIFREKTIKVLDENQAQLTYGWNHSYRPEASGGVHWDRLVDADGNTLYRMADFNALFQFAAE
jgi:hypothetical protein